jgi:hypothetical protein
MTTREADVTHLTTEQIEAGMDTSWQPRATVGDWR